MITVLKMTARFPVIIYENKKEIQTNLTPKELLHEIVTKEEPIKNLDRFDLALAFYETASEDLMLTFCYNYDMWLERYNNNDWSEETFKKRIGKHDAMDFETREDFEILKKMLYIS